MSGTDEQISAHISEMLRDHAARQDAIATMYVVIGLVLAIVLAIAHFRKWRASKRSEHV